MNFKKTWKRANEGFTLVELIVVIAILAILAGIAVPAYSGYIKKANEAADQQILAAVNTAFAAACLEESIDFNAVTNARLIYVSNSNGEGITISGATPTAVSGNYTVPSDFSTTFMFYLSDPVSTKVISNIYYVRGSGFTADDGKIVSGNMTGPQLQAAKDRVSASNTAGNETNLVQTVGNLSNKLAYQIENEGRELTDYMTDEEKAQYNAFMDSLKLGENPTSTEKANAAVLYAASVMKGETAESINQKIAAGEAEGKNMMTVLTEEYGTIATSAMMYGVITGYANSDYASEDFKKTYAETEINGLSGVSTLMGAMTQDSAWEQYYGSNEKGMMADVDGYLGAMEIVNGHNGSVNVSQSDAFTNQEIMDIVNSIFGK